MPNRHGIGSKLPVNARAGYATFAYTTAQTVRIWEQRFDKCEKLNSATDRPDGTDRHAYLERPLRSR